jgi:predicted ATPase
VKSRIGGEDPADALVERILERTDGIPLFVEEFAKIAGEAGQSLDEIPVTLQDLLLARLDRMQSDLRVIQLAGVLGREFPYEQLQAVSELDEAVLREELSKLVAAEILFQRGRLPKCRFLFKHALLQDAAYQSLLRKPRQEFHQRIAETLERRFPEVAAAEPEFLAQHFTEAGATAKAIEYWLAAGQRSQGRSANHEAIQQYRAGLAVIDTLPDSPERDQTESGFRLSLVTAIMAARGYAAPEVQPELQRARELCQRIGNQTQLLHVLWFIWAVDSGGTR